MKIVFNGREYASVDAMPETEREQYLAIVRRLGDADGNGIPDVAEKAGTPSLDVTVQRSLTYNGQPVNDPAELPPEVRALLDANADPRRPGGFTLQAGFRRGADRDAPTSLFRTPSGAGSRGNRIVLVLVLLVLTTIAVLWFRGIRPADLFGH